MVPQVEERDGTPEMIAVVPCRSIMSAKASLRFVKISDIRQAVEVLVSRPKNGIMLFRRCINDAIRHWQFIFPADVCRNDAQFGI